MEANQITVYIKYHRLDYYGKSSQIPMIVSADTTLDELKQRTAIKLKISPENQSMTLKQVNRIIPLESDTATLEELGVKDQARIFLEQINIHEPEDDKSSDEEIPLSPEDQKSIITQDASMKLSGLSNPKYFLKLGIMKKQLTGVNENEVDDVAAIIDDLIEKIKID